MPVPKAAAPRLRKSASSLFSFLLFHQHDHDRGDPGDDRDDAENRQKHDREGKQIRREDYVSKNTHDYFSPFFFFTRSTITTAVTAATTATTGAPSQVLI